MPLISLKDVLIEENIVVKKISKLDSEECCGCHNFITNDIAFKLYLGRELSYLCVNCASTKDEAFSKLGGEQAQWMYTFPGHRKHDGRQGIYLSLPLIICITLVALVKCTQ